MSIDKFFTSTLNRAWWREPGLDLYVRKSHRPNIDIELANLRADHPGHGALTRFLDKYEPKYSFFVENVLNPRLANYLLHRRGYIIDPSLPVYPPCFYRIKK